MQKCQNICCILTSIGSKIEKFISICTCVAQKTLTQWTCHAKSDYAVRVQWCVTYFLLSHVL